MRIASLVANTAPVAAAERQRPSLLSRIKVIDGIVKDDTVGGLGGGVRNVSINIPDISRLAEFAGGNHQEAVKLYFEPEGDLLSKILSLPAFTYTVEPSNSSFAYLADLETAVDFPVLVCMKSEEVRSGEERSDVLRRRVYGIYIHSQPPFLTPCFARRCRFLVAVLHLDRDGVQGA